MKGYSFTSAPLVVGGRLAIAGVPAGGEFGIRGFIDAYDVETGRHAWRFHTVPGPRACPAAKPGATPGRARERRRTGVAYRDLMILLLGPGLPRRGATRAPDYDGEDPPG